MSKNFETCEKLNIACKDTKVINIIDQDDDSWDLFQQYHNSQDSDKNQNQDQDFVGFIVQDGKGKCHLVLVDKNKDKKDKYDKLETFSLESYMLSHQIIGTTDVELEAPKLVYPRKNQDLTEKKLFDNVSSYCKSFA